MTRRLATAALVAIALGIGATGCIPPTPPEPTTTTLHPVVCQTERKTIETATEAWVIDHNPTMPPALIPTFEQLFEDRYLKRLDTTGWSIVPAGEPDWYTVLGPC